MTPDELKRILAKEGWVFAEGKKHALATHPDKPGIQIPIPRHKNQDIAKGTLENIMKAAGMKKK